MPFTTTIILASISFLLGLIFVCQTVDIPLLYRPELTPKAIEDAYTFYAIWWEAPGACKAVLHTALALPIFPLAWKLHKWTESAMFFDGTSLVLHMITLILYLTIHIPSLRTFLPESTTTTSFSILPPPPPRQVAPTESERVEAVRVLSAGNAIIGACLIGVILMQAGQEYARITEERAQRELEASNRPADVTTEKKEQ